MAFAPLANTFQTLAVTVTAPGTAQRLTAFYIPPGFKISLTARRSNTQNIYVAETAVKAQSGARKVLIPGQSREYQVDNTSRIFIDADNGTDVLEVALEQE